MRTFITIKDDEGIIRPMAYLETKERHQVGTHMRLEEGETFVEVSIVEVDTSI